MEEQIEESKGLAKGSFWQILGVVLVKLVSLIYVVLIARFLSQDDIGAFYLVLSVLGTVSIFGDLGLSSTASRYLPYFYGKGQNNNAKRFMEIVFKVGGLLSLVVSILIFLGAGIIASAFEKPQLAPIFEFMACYIFIGEIFNISTIILLGRKMAKQNSIAQASQNVLKLVFTFVAFSFYKKDWVALAGPFLLSYVIATAYAGFLVVREYQNIKSGKEKEMSTDEMLIEIIPFGITISLISTFYVFLSYTDKIIIAWLLPNEKALAMVAVYTMATSLATVSGVFAGAISSIFLPTISETYAKSERNFSKISAVTNTAMKWGILMTLPITLVFAIFPKEIMGIIYGASYEVGAASFAIFSIGILFSIIMGMQRITLAGMRKIDLELIMVAVAAIANIILNVVLVPLYGIDGSAAASAISLGMISILGYYYSKRVFKYELPKDLWKYAVGGLISAAVMVFIAPYVIDLMNQALIKQGPELTGAILDKIIKLGVFGFLYVAVTALYLLALHALKAFGKEELMLVRAALRKTRVPEPWVERIANKLGWDSND